jgi:hypothetical protein
VNVVRVASTILFYFIPNSKFSFYFSKLLMLAIRVTRLFEGQYSAYSSQLHPTRVQHSAVIEPPDERLPWRRVRKNTLAISSWMNGEIKAGGKRK